MKTLNLTHTRINDYTANFKKNLEILKNGGAVRITTVSGSGKWTSYYTCQYPSTVDGFDLVMCNDAPHGGQLGDYIAATKPGDKTTERVEFVRKFRKSWAKRMYAKNANRPDAIREQVKKAVNVIADMPAPEGDDRYYINAYHGCGVYRLAIQNGKIVATIHGGLHDSCPYLVDKTMWIKAIHQYLNERLGGDYKLVKADGSCTEFFLRDPEDFELLTTVQNIVPAPHGDGNLGYSHLNTKVNY